MTTPPPLDLAALRKTAEAVPGDTWYALGSGTAGGDHWYVCDEGEAIATIASQDGINEEEREPLARHIAAFDPPTVIALMDQVVTAEAAVARVRELHKPVPVYTTEAGDCEHEGACEAVELSDGAFCPSHTDGMTCNACAQTGEHMDGLPAYPCPTIQALDGGAS